MATIVTCPIEPRPRSAARRGRGTAGPRRAPGQLEGVPQAALDAGPGVDRGLDRDLLGRPLAGEPAGADVEVLVVLADDDHVDVVGPLARIGRLDAREEPDGAEVDVLVEIEPEPEQDPLLEHARAARRDGRRRRGRWRRTSRSSSSDRVGQDLAGLAGSARRRGRTGLSSYSKPVRAGDVARGPAGPRATTSGPTPSPAITPIVGKARLRRRCGPIDRGDPPRSGRHRVGAVARRMDHESE